MLGVWCESCYAFWNFCLPCLCQLQTSWSDPYLCRSPFILHTFPVQWQHPFHFCTWCLHCIEPIRSYVFEALKNHTCGKSPRNDCGQAWYVPLWCIEANNAHGMRLLQSQMDKRLCQAPNLEKWMLEKVDIICSSFLRQTCSSYSANVHFTHFPFLFTARAVRFGTFDYVIEQIQVQI